MKRNKEYGWMEWLLGLAAGVAFFMALCFPLYCAVGEELSKEEQRLLSAYKSGEIVRLHVVGQSNTPRDQAIKLYVRDALLRAFSPELKQAIEKDSSSGFAKLCGSVSDIRQICENALQDLGENGRITVEAGVLHIPSKQYGRILLPEGEYKALRITIGRGKGKNWWCVLYPQLCLALTDAPAPPEKNINWRSRSIFQHWLLVDTVPALHASQNML